MPRRPHRDDGREPGTPHEPITPPAPEGLTMTGLWRRHCITAHRRGVKQEALERLLVQMRQQLAAVYAEREG